MRTTRKRRHVPPLKVVLYECVRSPSLLIAFDAVDRNTGHFGMIQNRVSKGALRRKPSFIHKTAGDVNPSQREMLAVSRFDGIERWVDEHRPEQYLMQISVVVCTEDTILVRIERVVDPGRVLETVARKRGGKVTLSGNREIARDTDRGGNLVITATVRVLRNLRCAGKTARRCHRCGIRGCHLG